MVLGMVLVVFSGSWVFVSRHKHLLMMLLSLELIMVGFFGLLGGGASHVGEGGLMLMFLVFAACEGSVGLGLLVGVVRSHGNDNFKNFSVLQC